MRSLKLFVESNQKRTDEIGRLCRAVLSDSLIDWKGGQYDQMRRIGQLRGKFDPAVIDQFFREFKSLSV
jgi:pyruvate-formate lyase